MENEWVEDTWGSIIDLIHDGVSLDVEGYFQMDGLSRSRWRKVIAIGMHIGDYFSVSYDNSDFYIIRLSSDGPGEAVVHKDTIARCRWSDSGFNGLHKKWPGEV